MAQEGAPVERACDRCRERRVKCDKRHPACLRCEKLGKPCPGYDKKRKFVDEGVLLRKKYHASPSVWEESRSTLDNTAPPPRATAVQTSPPGLLATGGPYSDYDSPDTPAQHDGAASQSTARSWDKPSWNISSFDTRTLTNPIEQNRAGDENQAVPTFNSDQASSDPLGDPDFDPSWFDLDPTEYYSSGGNSCGFLSDFPNIVDEIDRDDFVQSIENDPTPFSTSDPGWDPAGSIWTPQLNTSALIVDEREHEMAYLIRHFREAIGPWMDLFDQDEHFGSLVPLKALRDALLRNAIAAVSAKQLGRVQKAKPYIDNQCQRPAMMEVIDEVDWFYKAANYYDKAIAFSRIYLQAISDNISHPLSPAAQQQVAKASSDDLLVAVSIFSLYEWLDNLELDWLQHLSGLKTLLNTMAERQEAELHSNPSITVGRRASFWNFTRADYHAAYINHQYTFLDTLDLHLWHSCGLQIQADGSLYHSPAEVKGSPLHGRSTAELVAHTMLYLVLKTMNYLALPPNQDQHTTITAPPSDREVCWAELTHQLDDWHRNLPQTFQPCAQMRYPVKPSSRYSTSNSSNQSQLTEVFFSMNVCAAALQLYHFARILLLLNKPNRTAAQRPSSSIYGPSHEAQTGVGETKTLQALKHAHQIIGIALGRPHPAVRVEMLLPLYVAGTCLEAREERDVVLELLRAIEKDTGCATEGRCRELMREWG